MLEKHYGIYDRDHLHGSSKLFIFTHIQMILGWHLSRWSIAVDLLFELSNQSSSMKTLNAS